MLGWKPRPKGVSVYKADGTQIACRVIRVRSRDHDGITVWLAVPRQPVILGPGDRLHVDQMPPGTSIGVEIS
jgi:hypothetical protein